jgi:lipopolysaccharide cholinephosphotransferase
MGTNKSFVKRLLRFPVYLYSHVKGTKYFLDKFDVLTNSYSYENSKYVGDLIWDNCVHIMRRNGSKMLRTLYLKV